MSVGPAQWSIVCAVLLSAVAPISATPASADTTDDAVVAALTRQGIAITDRDTALATAHAVCAGLDKNYKSSVLAMKLAKDTALSLRQSGYVIGVSVSAYCPQYVGRLDTSANWLNPRPPLM